MINTNKEPFNILDEINEIVEEPTETPPEETPDPSLFEGKEYTEYEYHLSYENLNEGLALVAKDRKGKDDKKIAIVMNTALVLSIISVVVLSSIVGILGFLVCMFYHNNKTFRPITNRRKIAQNISKRNDTYHIQLFDTGVKIIENEVEKEFGFTDLVYRDTENLMMLMLPQLTMILPKQYFGEDLGKVQDVFSQNCKHYNQI